MPPREEIDGQSFFLRPDSPSLDHSIRRRRIVLRPNGVLEHMPSDLSSSSTQSNGIVASSPISLRHRKRCTASNDCTGDASPFWIKRSWELHFVLSLGVLLLGIVSNHDSRKFIPIDPSHLGNGCEKAFLNTVSSSPDFPGSLICCSSLSVESEPWEMQLCNKSSWPFARRLSRLPEAWLIPLIPWVFHWFIILLSKFLHGNKHGSVLLWRRLGLYVSIMIFRGFILYQGMNHVEDFMLHGGHNDRHGNDLPTGENYTSTCWYGQWLRPDQAPCYGRAFDFSDHVVLYFAQILPICLTETLELLREKHIQIPARSPMRRIVSMPSMDLMTSMNGGVDLENEGLMIPKERSSAEYALFSLQRLLPYLAVLSTVYLYVITLCGAYRTTAFFHTGAEILAGYAVSLALQWPLFRLHCNRNNRSMNDPFHVWYFGKE